VLLAVGVIFFLPKHHKKDEVTDESMPYETEGTEVDLAVDDDESESDESDWDVDGLGAVLESAFEGESVDNQVTSTWDNKVFASDCDEF
jgi:hypothetical protein